MRPRLAKENDRCAATTFSSTVISRNSRVIWKVRPIPRWARFHDGRPSIRLPARGSRPTRRDRVVDQVEHRGLARAVGPDQSGDRAFGHGERRTVDRLDATEVLVQAANLQQRLLGRRRALAPLDQLEPTRSAGEAAAAADPGSGQARLARRTPPQQGRSDRGEDALGQEDNHGTSSPPNRNSRALPPPKELLAISFSGSIRNAPSTGPHRVPLPPTRSDRTIWTAAGC